jgi:hypothetical protein
MITALIVIALLHGSHGDLINPHDLWLQHRAEQA